MNRLTLLQGCGLAIMSLTGTHHAAAPVATPYPDAAAGDGNTQQGYNPLRWAEDWRGMLDPAKRNDVFDRLKYIPIGSDDLYLTLSGELRTRVNYFPNPQGRKSEHQRQDSYRIRRCRPPPQRAFPYIRRTCPRADGRQERRFAIGYAFEHVAGPAGLHRRIEPAAGEPRQQHGADQSDRRASPKARGVDNFLQALPVQGATDRRVFTAQDRRLVGEARDCDGTPRPVPGRAHTGDLQRAGRIVPEATVPRMSVRERARQFGPDADLPEVHWMLRLRGDPSAMLHDYGLNRRDPARPSGLAL